MDDAVALWLLSSLLTGMTAFLGLIALAYFQTVNRIADRQSPVNQKRSAHWILATFALVAWCFAVVSVFSSLFGLIYFRTEWMIVLSVVSAGLSVTTFSVFIALMIVSVAVFGSPPTSA